MNFIVIISDTLRRDHLGCYGNDWISTPNIDRFASKSLIFDRAYSGSFATVPHRRDVMTGRFTVSYTPWAPLSPDEVVLAQTLGDAGYVSMMICDCPHILENGYHYDRGFTGFEWIRGQETDRWKTDARVREDACDPAKLRGPDTLLPTHRRNTADWRLESDRFAARTMSAACEWLELNRKQDDFFLYIDTFDPHEPWDAPQWYVDMYDPGYTGQVVDYPRYWHTDYLTDAELKHCRALYAAEVTMVDRWVGRVFEKIEDLGLLDDTVVIFTSDHGFLLGEHGLIGKALIGETLTYVTLYEEINHVPFIVHRPDGARGRTNAIVQPMDIMPTILDAAGIAVPETVHGKSFDRVLRGEATYFRDFAVSSPFLGRGWVPATVVRDNWACILYPKSGGQVGSDRNVDGVEKDLGGLEETRDMLFDLAESAAQERSVADERPEVVERLRRDFVGFLTEVGTAKELVEQWEGNSAGR
ncbi:MAG: sulfatase [Armatimonadota bacterium]|nr:sulfatase [Armatimonadota bacterium]